MEVVFLAHVAMGAIRAKAKLISPPPCPPPRLIRAPCRALDREHVVPTVVAPGVPGVDHGDLPTLKVLATILLLECLNPRLCLVST